MKTQIEDNLPTFQMPSKKSELGMSGIQIQLYSNLRELLLNINRASKNYRNCARARIITEHEFFPILTHSISNSRPGSFIWRWKKCDGRILPSRVFWYDCDGL